MIKAILLDLDNTLLHNPDKGFAIEFLRRGDNFFRESWGNRLFSSAFRAAIQAMRAGQPPHRHTNKAITQEVISRESELPESDVINGLEAFYSIVYPTLKTCTSPVQGAKQLIDGLKAEGYLVVIATNPLYPIGAVQQRLDWAGLSSDPTYYAFITHNGNMHFAKPHPSYYGEILARVGVEPDEALMVGDSERNDIIPAKTAGLRTYHIVNNGIPSPIADSSGSLKAFYTDRHLLEKLTWHPLRSVMIEPELRASIGALFGLIDSIKPHFWTQHPYPQEWSPLQIVCHLLESELITQRPRLQKIRDHDNPFLATPKSPPEPANYKCTKTGEQCAEAFAFERLATIEMLRNLNEEDWNRPARHSIFGPTTLLEMAHFTAQHDRLHLNQLCQTLGHCE